MGLAGRPGGLLVHCPPPLPPSLKPPCPSAPIYPTILGCRESLACPEWCEPLAL